MVTKEGKFSFIKWGEFCPLLYKKEIDRNLNLDNWIDQDKTLTVNWAIYNLRQDKPAKIIGLNEYLHL